MTKRISSKAGFTLIEVILVIIVTAIAIPVLIFLLGQQARFTVDNEKTVNAAVLGQDLMEEIRSGGYASADGYDGYSDIKTLSTVQYTRNVQVCEVAPVDPDTCTGVAAGFKRIRVTVSSDIGTTEIVTLLTDS